MSLSWNFPAQAEPSRAGALQFLSWNRAVPLLVQELLFKWQYIAFFRANLDTIQMTLLSTFCLDKQKSFVPKKKVRHVSNQDFKMQNFLFTE